VVNVSFPALNKEVDAPINRIGNIIDPNNRTFKVMVNLENKNRMIKPNLISIIKIRDYVSNEAIVIPSLLVKEDFKGFYTFIADKKDNKFWAKKVYVTPGITNNNMTEITEGLSAGTNIISVGYNQVINGSEIQY
jgi:multidrug efflux pump subunit AcrA (membrane-fusion protein)